MAERPDATERKLCFLRNALAAAHGGADCIETHMSYVFLAGDRAFKLKKPVRYPFLDFSTVAARERNCREEVRLNRRLTQDVYLGVVALTRAGESFALGGTGDVVDWLVEMRRLPEALMLDRRILDREFTQADVGAVCDALAPFYRDAAPSFLSGEARYALLLGEQQRNRALLTDKAFELSCKATLDALDARLDDARDALCARRIVDGHGDLRPEHICLTHPVAIFDCLEFNAELRQVDPFDEMAMLGVECAILGAPDLLRRFVAALAARLNEAPPWSLVRVYAAWRAMLRARLSIAHLTEPSVRQRDKWRPQAQLYLDLAARALAGDL